MPGNAACKKYERSIRQCAGLAIKKFELQG